MSTACRGDFEQARRALDAAQTLDLVAELADEHPSVDEIPPALEAHGLLLVALSQTIGA